MDAGWKELKLSPSQKILHRDPGFYCYFPEAKIQQTTEKPAVQAALDGATVLCLHFNISYHTLCESYESKHI